MTVLATATSGCLSTANELKERLTGERDQKQRLVETYDRGLNTYNSAVQTLQFGITFEDWADVTDYIRPSIDEFEAATEHFTAAERQARAIDNSAAIQICTNAVERTRLMLRASRSALEAAELLADERRERGNELWTEYAALRDRAQETEMYPTRELVGVLGLRD